MTDASFVPSFPRVARTKTASVELPKPEPLGVPVLIGDCASPLAGETVLSLIYKRIHTGTKN